MPPAVLPLVIDSLAGRGRAGTRIARLLPVFERFGTSMQAEASESAGAPRRGESAAAPGLRYRDPARPAADDVTPGIVLAPSGTLYSCLRYRTGGDDGQVAGRPSQLSRFAAVASSTSSLKLR